MISSVPMRLREAIRWLETHEDETPRPPAVAHMLVMLDELRRLADLADKFVNPLTITKEGFRNVRCEFPTAVANPESAGESPCPEDLGHPGNHHPDYNRRLCPYCATSTLEAARTRDYLYCTRCGRGSLRR